MDDVCSSGPETRQMAWLMFKEQMGDKYILHRYCFVFKNKKMNHTLVNDAISLK